MKRCFQLFLMTILSVVIFASVPETASAQSAKQREKIYAKQYKRKIKEYKKEGWKLAGSSKTIEVVLLEHQAKLTEGSIEIVGEVSQCKSINVCKQSALNNAQNEYVRLVSGKIQGAFATILKANANRPQEEIDKMTGGLLNEVEAEISGVLTSSYSIEKDNGTGTKRFRTFFIVDESRTNKLLDNVLERSIKETKLTIEEAKSISTFVKEELQKEQEEE